MRVLPASQQQCRRQGPLFLYSDSIIAHSNIQHPTSEIMIQATDHHGGSDAIADDTPRSISGSTSCQGAVTGRDTNLSNVVAHPAELSTASTAVAHPSDFSDISLPPSVSFILQDTEARARASFARIPSLSFWTEYPLEEHDWEILRRHLEECGGITRYV